MADFNKYAPTLQKLEGGWSDSPYDAGGVTNMGVTLTVYREVFGQRSSIEDLRAMTTAQWREIMKGQYWDKCRADQIKNQSVAEIIVDWCINSGMAMVKRVQSMVGTTADGVVGPKTIAAINGADQRRLHCRIKRARAVMYGDLTDKSDGNLYNYDGWFSRLNTFKYSVK